MKGKHFISLMALVLLIGIAFQAKADTISGIYSITMSDFVDYANPSTTPPYDTFFLTFSIQFDNSANINDSSDIFLIDTNFTLGSDFVFDYIASSDYLIAGGLYGGASGVNPAGVPGPNPADFAVRIDDISTTTPYFLTALYREEDSPTWFRSWEGELTVSPVPEPSTILLWSIGLIGLARVSRNKFKK